MDDDDDDKSSISRTSADSDSDSDIEIIAGPHKIGPKLTVKNIKVVNKLPENVWPVPQTSTAYLVKLDDHEIPLVSGGKAMTLGHYIRSQVSLYPHTIAFLTHLIFTSSLRIRTHGEVVPLAKLLGTRRSGG